MSNASIADEVPSSYSTLPFVHEFNAEGQGNQNQDAGLLPKLFAKVKPYFGSSNTPESAPTVSSGPSPPSSRPAHSRKQSLANVTQTSMNDGPNPSSSPSQTTSPPKTAALPMKMRSTGPSGAIPFRLTAVVAPSVRLTPAFSSRGDLAPSAQLSSTTAVASVQSVGSGTESFSSSPTGDGSSTINYPYSSIPGFPLNRELLADDTRSVSSFGGGAFPPPKSLSHVFRRLRGEGLSKDYWMADASAKSCNDCNTAFSLYRRKHHCRICGQIFCGQCARNLIPGARFGVTGVVRVCNLCLAIMKSERREHHSHYLEDSSLSPTSTTSFDRLPSVHNLANSTSRIASPLAISAPLESQIRAPQSQFAASTLFPRAEFLNLASPWYDNPDLPESPNSTRPGTPFELDNIDDAAAYHAQKSKYKPRRFPPGELGSPFQGSNDTSMDSPDLGRANSPPGAPFRSGLADEDQDQETVQDHMDELVEDENTLGVKAADLAAYLASHASESAPAVEAVEFPASVLPAHLPPLPPPTRASRSRAGSRAAEIFDYEAAANDPTSLVRLMRARRDSLVTINNSPTMDDQIPELPPVALAHVRRLLHQMLTEAKVSNTFAWEITLSRLLARIARHPPQPNVRAGDPMDIRHFVRIKRMPGGRPGDSHFVDGVVCTKNVLHKGMPRQLSHPRVMLLTFPIEYQRIERQLVSLEPLINQEKDYLRNLVGRIIALRPHVVLCERNVSRLAIEYLCDARVAVARNVKPSIIQAVARCTNADIISSIERLATEPRLGRCGSWRVETIVHTLIPGGRKTFMRFEGCSRDLGATVVLRGGHLTTLAKVKHIVDFMVLAVYNLRLETFLFWDEHALPPILKMADLPKIDDGEIGNSEHHKKRSHLTKDIHSALKPYIENTVSASPSVIFPPPHPLVVMRDDNAALIKMQEAIDDEEAKRILMEETGSITDDLGEKVIEIPIVVVEDSTTPETNSGKRPSGVGRTLSQHVDDPSVEPTQAVILANKVVELQTRFNEHLRLYEYYRARHVDSMNPADHQSIIILHASICSTTLRACSGPDLLPIEYYRQNDLTLGQYLEDAVAQSGRTCGLKGCDRPRLLHYQVYVHSQYRIQVVTEQYPCPVPNAEERIIMWSYCKICKLATAHTFMSETTWHYSFGKYLELSFYHGDLTCLAEAADSCPHNVHRDHVRYFALRNLAVRVHIDPIKVCDAVAPPLRLSYAPNAQYQIREQEYLDIKEKTDGYWTSLETRVRAFNYELVAPERVENARNALAEIARRADIDERQLSTVLEETHQIATNVFSYSNFRCTLQDKIVDWEREFVNFEQKYVVDQRPIQSGLRRLFSDSSGPTSPEHRSTGFPAHLFAPSETEEKSEDAGGTIRASASEPHNLASLLSPATHELSRENLAAVDARLNKLAPPVSSDYSTSSQASSSLHTPSNTSSNPSISGDRDRDSDSDSTVCAESPRLQSTKPLPIASEVGATSELESDPGHSKESTLGIQTPNGTVNSLIKRFEQTTPAEKFNARPLGQSEPRPTLARRNKSEISRQNKSKPVARTDVFSDSEVPGKSNKSFVSRSTLPSRGSTYSNKSSRRTPSTISTAPKSGAELDADSSQSGTVSTPTAKSPSKPLRPMLSRNASTTGTLKEGRRQAAPEKMDSGSSSSKQPKTRLTGQRPPGRPPGTSRAFGSTTPSGPKSGFRKGAPSLVGSRVFSMRAQYESLANRHSKDQAAQAARLAMARRPIAAAKPVLEVFGNTKDALKDDFGDDGNDSNSEGGSADDEYEGEDSHPARHDRKETDTSQPTYHFADPSKESFVYQPIDANGTSPPPITMPLVRTPDGLPHLPVNLTKEELEALQRFSDGPSVPASPFLSSDTSSLPRLPHLSEGEMSSSGTERFKGSLMAKAFASLAVWAPRNGEFLPLEYPLLPSDHIFSNNPVIVREDEPSSVIAFTLCSRQYSEKLKESDVQPQISERTEAFMPAEYRHSAERGSTWGILDFQPDTDVEDVLRRPAPVHYKFQFNEAGNTFAVRVFYAEQFAALRRNCGCEEVFAESLSRCVKWNSQGGKSGSAFLKTKDDRFIIKQLSRPEADAFMKFAPTYFDYMARAFFHQLPTVLAKILGLYRISYNTVSGKSVKLDVLVMENLFYNRKMSIIFDLKGSTRNRHAPITGHPHEVLLDENLMEIVYKSPLYVREQSKVMLRNSLFNDTLFLADVNVMDYSLVVGVDADRDELVVGIIDFIRTYTWDKRVESWVKSGAGKAEPTIITPAQYKSRFRHAMESYFLLVPDIWCDPSVMLPVKEAAAKVADQQQNLAQRTTANL